VNLPAQIAGAIVCALVPPLPWRTADDLHVNTIADSLEHIDERASRALQMDLLLRHPEPSTAG
jgi:hypothetical protein